MLLDYTDIAIMISSCIQDARVAIKGLMAASKIRPWDFDSKS
jgi:hypothetical protein